MFKKFKYIITNIGEGEYNQDKPLTKNNIEKFVTEEGDVNYTSSDDSLTIDQEESDIIVNVEGLNLVEEYLTRLNF